jgi:Tfp pilus assembly protein PilO
LEKLPGVLSAALTILQEATKSLEARFKKLLQQIEAETEIRELQSKEK